MRGWLRCTMDLVHEKNKKQVQKTLRADRLLVHSEIR